VLRSSWISAVLRACLILVAFLEVFGQAQDQSLPTFRSGVDIVELDVTVVDRNRRPVRGLTAADFVVLEEGVPRPIYSFVAVDIPPASATTTAWQRDVAPDITTNQRPVGRIIVVVIDDWRTRGIWASRQAREVVRAIVNDLGPEDMAAIVFTWDNRSAQGLTNNRALLMAAVDTPALAPSSANDIARTRMWVTDPGVCRCDMCAINALKRVAEQLRGVTNRIKTLIYVSPGVSMSLSGNSPCYSEQAPALTEVFRLTQLANVRIHPFDPAGLRVGGPTAANKGPAPGARSGIRPNLEFLRNLAYTTGGRAVVNNNDPNQVVTEVLNESRSYYLIGFPPADLVSDGTLRPVEVRVNRAGLDVRTRRSFVQPVSAVAVPTPANSTALEESTIGLLARADIPMQAALMPFRGEDGDPAVAIALGVGALTDRSGDAAKLAHGVRLIARAYDAQGQLAVDQELSFELKPVVGTGTSRRYEVISRLPLPPGRFEVRLGVAAGSSAGSVYAHVEVSDFRRVPLSLSGLVLSAEPAWPIVPANPLTDVIPLYPTSRREFSATDRVTTFVRLYQGGTAPVLGASIAARLVDTRNVIVWREERELAVPEFALGRTADYRVDLPIARLAAGEYLLTVTARTPTASAERTARFDVR
jgi:VWFA-related protein